LKLGVYGVLATAIQTDPLITKNLLVGIILMQLNSLIGTNFIVKIIGPFICAVIFNVYTFENRTNEVGFILGINFIFLCELWLLYDRDRKHRMDFFKIYISNKKDKQYKNLLHNF
jgi:hypothetical protein